MSRRIALWREVSDRLSELRELQKMAIDGHPVDPGWLLELVSDLDRKLSDGVWMPTQWSAPGCEHPDPEWHHCVAILVTDPNSTLTEIRKTVAEQPSDPYRLLGLMTGLDYWIHLTHQLPNDWSPSKYK